MSSAGARNTTLKLGRGSECPGVPRPDLLPDHPGRAVAADQVAGGDLVAGPAAVPHSGRDLVVLLGQAGHGVTEPQVHPGLAADVGAQHLLHDGLGNLLAGLGEPLVPLRGQPERAVEIA